LDHHENTDAARAKDGRDRKESTMNDVNPVVLVLGLMVIAVAVYAVIRKADVRMVLIPAALALGTLAGDPMAIVQKFLATLADGKFVVPICTAMGFAYVLRFTECDQHLVQLLVKPLRRVRFLLIPGAVLVGFLVNIPVISQTSTAVAIGFVLIPLLLAARISPITAGAALLLGSSIGGELLNPGAPEYGTIAKELDTVNIAVTRTDVVSSTLPLDLAQLVVATAVFWLLSVRAETAHRRKQEALTGAATVPTVAAAPAAVVEDNPAFRVNLLKAAVPLLPLVPAVPDLQSLRGVLAAPGVAGKRDGSRRAQGAGGAKPVRHPADRRGDADRRGGGGADDAWHGGRTAADAGNRQSVL
jgi:DcuC family C4-dicarboxylate transporter